MIYIYGRDVTGANNVIVCKYYLFISQSFEYTVYFIVMVYLLRSVVIIIVVVVKTFHFFPFSGRRCSTQLAP